MVCNALANTTIKVLGVSYAGFVRNMSALRNTKTLVSLVLARLFKNYGIRVVFKSNIVWGKGNSADRCNSKFIHGDKGGPPGGGGTFFSCSLAGEEKGSEETGPGRRPRSVAQGTSNQAKVTGCEPWGLGENSRLFFFFFFWGRGSTGMDGKSIINWLFFFPLDMCKLCELAFCILNFAPLHFAF